MVPHLCSFPALNLVAMIRKTPTSFHDLQSTKQGLAAPASHTHSLERQTYGAWGQQEYPFFIFSNLTTISPEFPDSEILQSLEITSCDKGRYNLLCLNSIHPWFLVRSYAPPNKSKTQLKNMQPRSYWNTKLCNNLNQWDYGSNTAGDLNSDWANHLELIISMSFPRSLFLKGALLAQFSQNLFSEMV